MIVYIHGFGGSGEGVKARLFREYFESAGEAFMAPSLSYVPDLAIKTLEDITGSCAKAVKLIGSSLGGYYASYLSQRTEVEKVVLINPAVEPCSTLQRALGEAPNFYDGSYFSWTPDHLRMLESYGGYTIQRDKILLMLQKGDELLDYRDALDMYEGCETIVEEGGSHSFEGIERHFETVKEFFCRK